MAQEQERVEPSPLENLKQRVRYGYVDYPDLIAESKLTKEQLVLPDVIDAAKAGIKHFFSRGNFEEAFKAAEVFNLSDYVSNPDPELKEEILNGVAVYLMTLDQDDQAARQPVQEYTKETAQLLGNLGKAHISKKEVLDHLLKEKKHFNEEFLNQVFRDTYND